MRLNNARYRILLHLLGQKDVTDYYEVPYRLCQNGIAEAVNLSRSRASKIIRELIKKGWVKEATKRVVGLKRRRKTYSLTNEGIKNAKDIKDKLERTDVIVKTKSSEHEIKLKEINSYIDSKDPLLVALNRVNEEDIIDITQPERQTQDIFAGRKDEIQYLSEILGRVKNEGVHTVLIKGRAGVGKTRLINEFRQVAISEGFGFLTGKGHYDTSEPYLPFKEAFQRFDRKESKLLKFSTDLEREKDIKNEYRIKSRRYLVFSKSTKNIRKLAEERPMVIFIDDFQWVDKASSTFFHYLAKKLKGLPILLIGAYRPEDIRRDHHIKEVLQRMGREQLYEVLELEPLKIVHTQKIVQGLIGKMDIPEDFVKLIHETSEGNPLFAKEFVKMMLEEGILEPNNNRYPSKNDDFELPKMVNDIIERRINRLDKENLKILRVGSIIGERVPFTVLQDLTKMDDFELLEHIDILTGSSIWESEPQEDYFTFAHGLIQLTVYEGIPEPLKKSLHIKIANSLKELFQDDLEYYYSDIAFHYRRGGNFSKEVSYLMKAGERADQVYAHEDALEMYKEALEQARKANLDKERWEIMERLGDVYTVTGRYDSSLEHYKKIPLEKLDGGSRQRIYRKKASVFERVGDFDKSLEFISRGLSENKQFTIESCRLLCKKGIVMMRRGQYDDAESNLLKALALCDDFYDEKTSADVHQNLGIVYLYKGEHEKSIEYLESALKSYGDMGNLIGKASTLDSLGHIYLNTGDLDDALEYFKEGYDIIKKTGDKRAISFTLNDIGTIYSKRGEIEKAIDCYEECHKIWKAIGDKRGIGIYLQNIGECYLKIGELSSARECHNKGIKIFDEINSKKRAAICSTNMGKMYSLKGELDEARNYFERSLETCEQIGYKYQKTLNLLGLGEIYIQKEEVEKAIEKVSEALEISNIIAFKIGEGISRRTLGMAYRKNKEWKRAKKEFEIGKEILYSAKDKSELGKLLYQYALLWKDMEEDEKFKENMKKARSMFDDVGMKLWLEECERELEG